MQAKTNSREHHSSVEVEKIAIKQSKENKKSLYASNITEYSKNKVKQVGLAVSRIFDFNKKEDKTRALSITFKQSESPEPDVRAMIESCPEVRMRLEGTRHTLNYQYSKYLYRKIVKRLEEEESSIWYDHLEQLTAEFREIREVYDHFTATKNENKLHETASKRTKKNLAIFLSKD